VLGQSYRCPPAVQKISDGIISDVKHRRPKKWNAKTGGPGVVDYAPNIANVELPTSGSVLVLARNNSVLEQRIEPALRAEGIVYEMKNKSSIDPDMVRGIRAWTTASKGEPITLGEARCMYKYISANKGVAKGYKTLPKYGEDEDIPVTMTDLIQTGGLKVDPNLIWHDALDRLPVDDMSYLLAALRRGEKLRGAARVRLSTIHSAKGGEADHVVVMKEIVGRTWEELHLHPDDERRCWYVAVTRARERLTVVRSDTKKECPWI